MPGINIIMVYYTISHFDTSIYFLEAAISSKYIFNTRVVETYDVSSSFCSDRCSVLSPDRC